MATEVFFDGQRDNEQVIGLWRRNPMTMAKQGFLALVGTLFVVAAFRWFGASLASSLALGLWLIVIPAYIGITWYRWWNDLYILTNLRLVDVDQKGLFHRTVSEIPLENIQDVSFETNGIIQTALNYGAVIVQTSSVTTQVELADVTDPQAIQQTVLRTVADVKKGHRTGKTDEKQEPEPPKAVTQLG